MTEAAKKFMNMSIWITISIFIVRLCITWGEIKNAVDSKEIIRCCYILFGYAGEAIGIAAVFMACFNKWIWKWKPLNWILGEMPILAQKYNGKIRFIWENEEQERNITISIKQTFLKVIVKLGSDESNSNTVMATIIEINGSQMLMYTYLNIPRAELQDRSAIHYGTAMLDIDDPNHIIGNYYTTRQTRGSMDLKAVAE